MIYSFGVSLVFAQCDSNTFLLELGEGSVVMC